MHKAFLALWVVSVFVSLFIYTFQTHQYPQWDEHHYLTIAVKTLDAIHTKGFIGFGDSIPISGSRQPIYPLVITILLLIFGTAHTYKLALLVNAVLFSLTIIGTYIVSRQFFSKSSSLMVAILTGTYGNALFYAHFTYVETAVTAVIVWAMVSILKTKYFSHRKWTILAAVLTATATLTRFIAPVFLVGPVALTIIQALRISKQKNNVVTNMGIFLIISIATPAFLYFLPNYKPFMEYVYNNQTYGSEWVAQYRDAAMANTFSTRSIMYYFNILQQNTILPFLLFIAGFSLMIAIIGKTFIAKKKEDLFPIFFFLFSFVIPYSFLTFITIWKEDRFLVSIYPVVALISGVFIEKLWRFRRVSITAITIITVVATMNFMGALFGIGPMGQKGLVDYITPHWWPHPRRIYLTPIVWLPTREYANANIFIQTIENDWHASGKATIGVTFNHEPFLNALSSILTYEKRNLAELSLNRTASDSGNLDYLTTSPELPSNPTWKKMQNITIPYDGSTIFVYKKAIN